MMITILSIVYCEPDWQETKGCIESTGLPVVYVDRNPKGVGSLSEAINRGMKECSDEYVWIVTNILFDPDVARRLMISLECSNATAIHPAFESDHAHLRPAWDKVVEPVPFIEFTAPLIKRSEWIDLDESMPYWGQDLDWSYRVWKSGGRIMCDYEIKILHTYIRNKAIHPVTAQRYRLRRMTNHKTKLHLEKKYGKEWRGIVFPKTEQQIGRFYEQVKNKHMKWT